MERVELPVMIGAWVSGSQEPVWRENRDTASTSGAPAA
jgi:hypothetical protein